MFYPPFINYVDDYQKLFYVHFIPWMEQAEFMNLIIVSSAWKIRFMPFNYKKCDFFGAFFPRFAAFIFKVAFCQE